MDLKIIHIVILLVMGIFILPLPYSVLANPIPVQPIIVDDGSNPMPVSETPLFLKSEAVTFEMGSVAVITGEYTISNPTNFTINQTIIFPFFEHEGYGDERYGHYGIEVWHVYSNGSYLPFEYQEPNDNHNRAISFNITVYPYEDLNFTIKFESVYARSSSNECRLTYITTTARAWNHSIEHAFFQFRFKNTSIVGEPMGGDNVTITDSHVITTIERYNWTVQENITITWTKPEEYDPEGDNGSGGSKSESSEEEKKLFTPAFENIIFIISIMISVLIIRRRTPRDIFRS